MLYVDFKKAFDYLVHVKLYTSLINKGAHGKLLNVMASTYAKLKYFVKIDKQSVY